MSQIIDQKFISYAINLSKRNLGITSPNPVVGCVITKNNQIISTGVTAKNGRPHAETIAIEQALHKGVSLEGATLYVTLEPCSHFGKTPPCVAEIIKNKISRVVISTIDPDKRVNGQGIDKLREAGIEVIVGLMEEEAKKINKGFFKSKMAEMPYVTLKLATSLDGKIATKNHDSKWITGEKARNFSHQLRAINDAIMVGASTVRKDNPMLDCRVSGLEEYSPKRVIVANNLNFDENLEIFKTAKKIPTFILTYEQNFDAKKFDKLHVEIIFCEKKHDKIDLRNGLKKLHEKGVNSILVEGGQSLATEFLKENLIDELIWIRNKKIIGNDGIAAIGDLDISTINQALNSFKRSSLNTIEDDIVEILTVSI
ncbi:MAG: bifunctional diaminohydroxyphosphoribosylaminopyrimidine deaminase/5-amino-6-(5-phosphoribosylamino)uracil reductase RibD [Rickettsiales bacterium]|nr:bifunctional diaminohydroxyphosphoribosylaminopyrimidine deaminase/5-amino-6-(5-phosphoribosylamino)uracil reductase RibD [Rickettsiales bacterium]